MASYSACVEGVTLLCFSLVGKPDVLEAVQLGFVISVRVADFPLSQRIMPNPPVANRKCSERAVFVARKISLTPVVPTVEARTGWPPFIKLKLVGLLPFDK